eukprot:gene13115-3652_t
MADHPLEALVLRMLGHQHQAWDSPHLTRPVRCNRMANLHWLLREATLPALNGPVSELAKWANNDVKQKCLGFTTHLLFVFMANIEGHMQSMKNHPSAARLFVERAASTDDLETEFSLVSDCWLMDTGAASHATGDKTLLTHIRDLPQPITIRTAGPTPLTIIRMRRA